MDFIEFLQYLVDDDVPWKLLKILNEQLWCFLLESV